MSSKPEKLVTTGLSEVAPATDAGLEKFLNELHTRPIGPSAMDIYWSSRKADLPPATEQSSVWSKNNTVPLTLDSYSKSTITAQSSSEKDTQTGQSETGLFAPWVKQSLPSGSKAETYDDGKAPLAQLPWAAVEALSRVQMYGHKKYKDFNNYRKGMEVTRNLSCALRHIKEYLEGHDQDKESGESPLAHAMTRIAFVLQNQADGTAIDDRYKPGLERYQ